MAKVLRVVNMNKCIGCFTCMTVCAGVNKKNHSLSKSAIRVRTTGGMTSRFVAVICVGCEDERPCALACPTGAIIPRDGGGVLVERDKCIGCRKCIDACIVGAVHFDEEEKKPIICRQCGACVKYCPHDCFSMVENGGDDKE